MADRFYVNHPLAPGFVELEGPEGHHLATVCRLRPGSQVCLFNGDGQEYNAVVRQVARRQVSLEIVSVARPERELSYQVEVAAPLPKADRAQFLVEKLTELGATRYVPLRTERYRESEGGPAARWLQRRGAMPDLNIETRQGRTHRTRLAVAFVLALVMGSTTLPR